MRTYK